MARRFYSLTLAALLVSMGIGAVAHAQDAVLTPAPPAVETTQPAADARAPMRLAQARVFDVYVDERGREVIVDSRTGEVVEVRPPQGGADPYPRRGYERDRDAYGYNGGGDPYGRDGARRHRRDVELGRREPPVRDRRAVRIGPDGFPEIPPSPDMLNDRRAPESFTPAPVERQPLPAPSGRDDSEFASAPDSQLRPLEGGDGILDDGRLGDQGSFTNLGEEGSQQTLAEPGGTPAIEPFQPGDNAISVPGARGATEEVAKFQVLLDRAGASPGVIDGRMGDNVNKAIDAYKIIKGQSLRTYDKDWIEEQLAATGGPAFIDYTITAQDAAGPYIASIPDDYGQKAQLQKLPYTSVVEMLAERFHMDEDYLKALNPQANFNRPGTIIKVTNIGSSVRGEVASIIADKKREQVRAYDAGGKLLAAYPTTIGSTATPSPTGVHAVARVAFDPNYTYNPKINFKQGENDKILTIPPGPNGPVGSIWIALDKPTYGIHGTPAPSTIGKTSSHGCVRLTNWDATELAKMVKKGVTVEFTD